jgi:hypothetical protein
MFQGEKSKTNANFVSNETNPESYRIATDVIHWFSEEYKLAYSGKMELYDKQGIVKINIVGPRHAITYCLLRTDCHNSNRVYFKLKIKGNCYWMQSHCYNNECKKQYKELYTPKPERLSNDRLYILSRVQKKLPFALVKKLQECFGMSGSFGLEDQMITDVPINRASLLYDKRIGMWVTPDALQEPISGLMQTEPVTDVIPAVKRQKKIDTTLSEDDVLSQFLQFIS